MNQRLNPTTGRPKPLASEPLDEIVNVVSTGLIIGMIISLVFFLVIAFYRGDYDMRLMYILGLYVFATVLVARIAIDSGRASANAFGLALFAAASLAMFRFVSITGPMSGLSPVINIGLLLVAWFLADRITFDCTWINERDPSYQIGLLQSLKLIAPPKAPIKPTDTVPSGAPIAADGTKENTPVRRRKHPIKKHNPGVWILYFALLAIPLFGLGQITISNDRARAEAFKYLIAYLSCSLLLLLTTNFAGMRRYLRQRGTAMPDDMSRVWISYGGIGIAMILIACLLLPLPTKSGVGFAWLPFDFTSPQGLLASRFGWGNEGPDSGDAGSTAGERPAGQANPQANAEDKGNSRPGSTEAGQKQRNSQGESNDSPPPSDKAAPSTKPGEESTRSTPSSDRQSNSQNPGDPQANQSSPDSKPGDSTSQDARSGKGKPNDNTQSDSPGSGEQDSPNGQPQSSQDTNQPSSPTQSDDKKQSDASGKKPRDNRSSDTSPSTDPQNPNPNATDNTQQPPPQRDTETRQQQPSQRPNAASQSPDNPPTSQPQTSPSNWPNFSIPNLESMMKWILIAVLVAIVVLYAFLYPQEIAKLWRSIVDFLSSLFGNRKTTATVEQKSDRVETERSRMERPSFSSYLDPFSNNSAIEPKEVVVQTFAALEAWAHEHGVDRLPDQTAEEFSRRLTRTHPSLTQHAALVAQMHDRILFAGWSPKSNDVLPLANLWRILKGN